MQLDDAAHILGAADFFSICSLEQRRMLAFASDRRALKKGESLFRSGDVIDGAYVLISGVLNAQDKATKAEKGVEISQSGTVIGELALIAKHPRRVTVTAQTDAEVLLVPRETFAKLIQQFPDLAEKAADKIRSDIGSYVGAIGHVGDKVAKKA